MKTFFHKLLAYFSTQAENEQTNVVDSIVKSKRLYQHLILLCHPDRNPLKQDLAQELTNMLNANRYNYNELIRIKGIIETKLRSNENN